MRRVDRLSIVIVGTGLPSAPTTHGFNDQCAIGGSASAFGVYEGKRYSARQASRRTWTTGLTYVFGLSDGSVIDAAVDGNPTKHLNHSCTPNCEAYEETGPDGEARIVFYALRPIRAGEELFLDYSLVVDETEAPDAFGCSCGTTQCRGTMLAAR